MKDALRASSRAIGMRGVLARQLSQAPAISPLPARDLQLVPLGSGRPQVNLPRGGATEETCSGSDCNCFKADLPAVTDGCGWLGDRSKHQTQLSVSLYVTLCLLPGFLFKNLFLQMVLKKTQMNFFSSGV